MRPLRDTAVHSVAFVTDGSSWWEVDLIDRDQPNDEPWVGHIQPAHVGPMRGKLPPANEVGADPVEIAAAELAVADDIDFHEHLGWIVHRKGGSAQGGPRQRAGWLARQIVEGDS